MGARDLMVILYDPKYLSATTIFVLYIIVDMFRFANTTIVFAAKGRTTELIIYSGSAVLSNLVLNIWFFNIFGIVGPAISTVLITCVLSVIMLFRSGQLLKTKVTELINVKQMLTILVEIIICGIIAHQIQIRFLDGFSSLVTFGLTFVSYGKPLLLLNFKRVLALLKGINSVKMQ